MTDELKSSVVNKMNELYINERHKLLQQYIDKDTKEVKYSTKFWTLNDKQIEKHLEQKTTIGLFSFKYQTKFICFDVDTKEQSRLDTLHLVNVLVNDFNLCRDDIHVSSSGSKGYHVEIFFNKSISNEIAKRFYNAVINEAGFTREQVEYRPEHSVGLKLPLGLHRKTNKTCWYCDNQTLKEIERYDYILDIETIDVTPIIDVYDKSDPIVLEQEQAEEFESLIKTVNMSTLYTEDNLMHMNYVLENNCLKYPSSRNNVTLMTSIYLKDVEGFNKETTLSTLTFIMLNTKKTQPSLINSSVSFIEKETKRIVDVVYKNDYKFNMRKKDVRITLEDINQILSIKKWNLKQLYLIHLIHAKRYADKQQIYYMSYSTMSKYGAIKNNRSRLRAQINELGEFIEVVQSNVVDREESIKKGEVVKLPNFYKIKKIFNQDTESKDSILIKEDEISLELILKQFAESFEIDLRASLPRRQFDKIRSY